MAASWRTERSRVAIVSKWVGFSINASPWCEEWTVSRYAGVVLVWLLITTGYAAMYVHSRTGMDSPELYARTWQFQLLMFGIFRLPLLVLALIITLIGVSRILRLRRSS
ncbi:hypothetical protein DRW03_05625 [Corallococcus sp. H22C18031201]|uniref:hypothetical protein n=1 Tax=Citreicoccus inhibens TaxID=2849499 RepID=UPI000E74116B|nr:hypothetical protein [Citreicoccus inhibens]MBU8896079.1 hypothetical protein [Citreicoccus inhibens]RJS25949.1 hypothetical protein DRW03_05625 [Corallococcus sp. H22C18031201]